VRISSLVGSRLTRFLICGALVACLIGGLATTALANGGSTFVSLTNEKRASVGLGPVALSSPVDQIAVERGKQMAAADEMYHDLTYVTQRLGQLGVCWTGVGEIIAWESGYPTHSYQRTIDAWWASPGHHAIMVGDYNVAGGSWSVSSTGGTYSVMIFVKTCASTGSAVAPTIVARSPASGATGVSLWPTVSVRFSENVQGVSTSTMVLRVTSTGTIVPSTVSYDASTFTARLRPSITLALGRWYTMTVSSSIRDADGNHFKTTSWSFKTTTTQVYNPPRTLYFSAGKHVGYKFSSTGATLSTKTYSLSHSSSASTSKRAVIPGRSGTWFYVTNGVWAGYWVQACSWVYLI
jgi:Bacterial Ig-like domain/Cysteine-rich secretory protein family